MSGVDFDLLAALPTFSPLRCCGGLIPSAALAALREVLSEPFCPVCGEPLEAE